MKLVDVNLLLYAYDGSSRHHEAARTWLTNTFNAPEPTGLTHATILAFVRISTSPRILLEPLSIDSACTIVDDWLRQPSIVLLAATANHWRLFADLAIASQSVGALVPDTDLAASAFEHGATLCTNDRDFSRFPKLRVEYPLANRA